MRGFQAISCQANLSEIICFLKAFYMRKRSLLYLLVQLFFNRKSIAMVSIMKNLIFAMVAVIIVFPAFASENNVTDYSIFKRPDTTLPFNAIKLGSSDACGVGTDKKTQMKCQPCSSGFHNVKAIVECTQALDPSGKPCGTILCEQCLCAPN